MYVMKLFHALVPAQIDHRVEIAGGGHVVGAAAEPRKAERPQRAGDHPLQCGVDVGDDGHH
jgi:hypothetical protein